MITKFTDWLNEAAKSAIPIDTLLKLAKDYANKNSPETEDMTDEFMEKFDLYDQEIGRLNYTSYMPCVLLEDRKPRFPTPIVQGKMEEIDSKTATDLMLIFDEFFFGEEEGDPGLALADDWYVQQPSPEVLKFAAQWGFTATVIVHDLKLSPKSIKNGVISRNFAIIFIFDEKTSQDYRGSVTGKRFKV
jgi:hypothetical protein